MPLATINRNGNAKSLVINRAAAQIAALHAEHSHATAATERRR